MAGFAALLRHNQNYRRLWAAQIISEIGDHFNTIAVLTLTLHITDSGLAVGGVMLSLVLPEWKQSSALLYLLSALVMFASPFFTSGRMAILPRITTREELHTANAL